MNGGSEPSQIILNTRIKPFMGKFNLDFQKGNKKNCVKITSCNTMDKIICNINTVNAYHSSDI